MKKAMFIIGFCIIIRMIGAQNDYYNVPDESPIIEDGYEFLDKDYLDMILSSDDESRYDEPEYFGYYGYQS